MFAEEKPKSELEEQIATVLAVMSTTSVESEEYGVLLDRLQKLHKMDLEKRPLRASPDTVIGAVTNILGILLITRYEYENVITSKALGFVPKLR